MIGALSAIHREGRLRRGVSLPALVLGASGLLLTLVASPVAAYGSDAPPAGVSAAASPEPAPISIRAGLRAGGGAGVISRPSDAAGEPTFLYGAGFSGPALRLASSFGLPLTPWLRARQEIGLGWTRLEGSASEGDRSREIIFRLTTVDLLLGPEAHTRLGDTRLEAFGGFALGPRFGVRASARDRRVGFDTDEDLLRLRLSTALILGMEAGVAWHSPGGLRVPVSLRWTRNLTAPSDTAGRLEASEDPELGPRYRVEATWALTGVLGVDF